MILVFQSLVYLLKITLFQNKKVKFLFSKLNLRPKTCLLEIEACNSVADTVATHYYVTKIGGHRSQSQTTDAQRGNFLHCTAEIQSQSQIFRYGRNIFCLPHRPNFSDIFDLCLHWVSVVRGLNGYFLNIQPIFDT